MSNKFLTGSSSAFDLSILKDGSQELYLKELKIGDIAPNSGVLTDADKILTSGIQQNVVTNPYNQKLKVSDLETDNFNSLNAKIQELENIDSNVTLNEAYTNGDGSIDLTTGKNLVIKSVDTSSIFEVFGDTKVVSIDGFLLVNGVNVQESIEDLTNKTQNMTSQPTITEFTGSLLLNGQELGGDDNSTLQSVYNTQADGKILLANNKPFVIENAAGNNFYLDDNSFNVISDSNIWLDNGRTFNILSGNPSLPFGISILQATQNDITIKQLICDNITPLTTNSNIGGVLNPYEELYLSSRIQAGNKIIDLSQPSSIGVNVPIKTTQTNFNDDDELVTKKFVDDSIGNIPVVDLTDLETKTANINLSSTATNTNFNGGFVSNGNVSFNGTGNMQIQNIGSVQIQNTGTLQIQPTSLLTLKACSILGELNMSNNKIVGLSQVPTTDFEASNKKYVDDSISNIPPPDLSVLNDKTQNIILPETDNSKTVFANDVYKKESVTNLGQYLTTSGVIISGDVNTPFDGTTNSLLLEEPTPNVQIITFDIESLAIEFPDLTGDIVLLGQPQQRAVYTVKATGQTFTRQFNDEPQPGSDINECPINRSLSELSALRIESNIAIFGDFQCRLNNVKVGGIELVDGLEVDRKFATEKYVNDKDNKFVKRFQNTVDTVLYEDDFVRFDWITADAQPSYVLKTLPNGDGAFPNYVDVNILFVGGASSIGNNGDGSNILNQKSFFNGQTLLDSAFDHLNYGCKSICSLSSENDINYPYYRMEVMTGDITRTGVCIIEKF
jgi:hypothetical protein